MLKVTIETPCWYGLSHKGESNKYSINKIKFLFEITYKNFRYQRSVLVNLQNPMVVSEYSQISFIQYFWLRDISNKAFCPLYFFHNFFSEHNWQIPVLDKLHSLSDCHWTRTHNHLVQTFSQTGQFIYELSGCGFDSSWSHLNFRFRACFEQGVPWHSGNYRVWIYSETRSWHDKKTQSNVTVSYDFCLEECKANLRNNYLSILARSVWRSLCLVGKAALVTLMN